MILGISGRAGSGKDAAAAVLVKKHGFVRVAFADELKRVAQRLFGWDHERLWGPSERRNEPDPAFPREHGPFSQDRRCMCCGAQAEVDTTLANVLFVLKSRGQCLLTARFALQYLGTEVGRGIYSDVWVRQVLRVHEELQKGSFHYDETSGLHRVGMVPGEKVHVVVPDVRFRNEVDALRRAGGIVLRVVRPGAGLAGESGAHSSENELTDCDEYFDARIVNDGTLEEFEARVGAFASRWFGT